MKNFNMQMNIAKAIAITAIIACHTQWDLFGSLFCNASWHVPFFFFISGYFFNMDRSFCGIIRKTTLKYFGWLYGYHFFYAGVTVLVYLLFGKIYGEIPALKNLTISILHSEPFLFEAPNWFLSCLAVSVLIFLIIMKICKKISGNCYLPAIVFVPAAISAIFFSKPDYQESFGIVRVLLRTGISIFYIYAGWLYRNKIEKFVKYNTKWLCSVLVIQVCLLAIFTGKFGMDIHLGKFFHSLSPLIIPFTGIYFVLFASKLLEPFVKDGSFIDKAGRNTLHIMANHLFVIFLIEVIIFSIDGKNFSELPDFGHFYKIGKYKFLYTFISLAVCTYLGEFINCKLKIVKKVPVFLYDHLKKINFPNK